MQHNMQNDKRGKRTNRTDKNMERIASKKKGEYPNQELSPINVI